MIANTHKNKYQAYASATQAVAKTQQIVLLYDGMIRLIQQAKEAIQEKRIEDRYNLLMKAGAILHGLQGCLDFENGKEIANVLYSFYSSVDSRMFAVHRDNSTATCDEIINDLKQMRDAWIAVDEKVLADTAPSVAPPAGTAETLAADTTAATTIILSA